MQGLNKTKAALPGRQCQSTKLKPTQNSTLVDLVKSAYRVFPQSEDNPRYSRSLSLAHPDVSISARISTKLQSLSAVRPKLETSNQSRIPSLGLQSETCRHLWRLLRQPFESDFKLNEVLALSPELGSWEAFISPETNPFRNQYKIKPVTAKNTICPLVGIEISPLNSQTFRVQSVFSWYLIFFSCSLNSFLRESSSAFKTLYFSLSPLNFIAEIADSSCSGSFKFVGKIEPGLPVISAALCLHNTVAGHSHLIPIWPATSKTTTLYRSVLLLLSAENVYSMTFLRSDIFLLVIGCQPFDPLLSRFKRCQQASFTQELNWPCPAASSTCCNRSSSNRMFFIVLPERSNLCLELFSCIGRYRSCKLESDGTYRQIQKQLKTAKPGSGGTLTGPLTKPLSEVTIMADIQSTQTRPEFTWRFLSRVCDTPDSRIIVVYTNASTEAEARANCPSWDLIFAARLPLHEFEVVRYA